MLIQKGIELTKLDTLLFEELQAAGQLPTPPGVVVRLLELTKRPDASAREIADTVAMDPSLSAKILRFVNSPLAGLRRQVASVSQAVALMGVRGVKMMALSFAVLHRPDRLHRRSQRSRTVAADGWARS